MASSIIFHNNFNINDIFIKCLRELEEYSPGERSRFSRSISEPAFPASVVEVDPGTVRELSCKVMNKPAYIVAK